MENQNKIRITFGWSRFDRLGKAADELADTANEVIIPVLESLEIPVTKAEIVATMRDPERPFAVLSEQVEAKGRFERAAQLECVRKAVDEAERPYIGRMAKRDPNEEALAFLNLENGVMVVDREALEESCAVYLTEPGEIEARNYLQSLADRLTEIVRCVGIMPVRWSTLFQVNPETGELSPAPDINPYAKIAAMLKEDMRQTAREVEADLKQIQSKGDADRKQGESRPSADGKRNGSKAQAR